MDTIVPGYYWASRSSTNEVIIVEIDDEWPWIYLMGTDELFYLEEFELLQKIEIPQFVLDYIDRRDYEDNKRPAPSLQ